MNLGLPVKNKKTKQQTNYTPFFNHRLTRPFFVTRLTGGGGGGRNHYLKIVISNIAELHQPPPPRHPLTLTAYSTRYGCYGGCHNLMSDRLCTLAGCRLDEVK